MRLQKLSCTKQILRLSQAQQNVEHALNETKHAVPNTLSYRCHPLSGSQNTCWSLLLLPRHNLDTVRLELVQTVLLQRVNLHQTKPQGYFLLPTSCQVEMTE